MSRQDIAAVRLTLSALFLTFFVLFLLLINIVSSLPCSIYFCRPPFSELWANTSPYYPAAPYEGSTPKGCVVSQVNIVSCDPRLCRTFFSFHSTFKLQRHGARYPTSHLAKEITTVLAKLQAVAIYNNTELEFIRSYTYDLGEEDLVRFGAYQ